jgi:hypothetical protein
MRPGVATVAACRCRRRRRSRRDLRVVAPIRVLSNGLRLHSRHERLQSRCGHEIYNLACGLVRTAGCTSEPHARTTAEADRRANSDRTRLWEIFGVSSATATTWRPPAMAVPWRAPPILTPLPGKQCGHRQWIGDLFKRSCAMSTALLAGHSSDDTRASRHDGGHDRGLLAPWAR